MYFPFLKLHGWDKRSAAQSPAISSEFPKFLVDILPGRLYNGTTESKLKEV